MKQLALPINEEFFSSYEFFVTKCNEEAYRMLISEYDIQNLPFQRIVLTGPQSCGKSRLAKLWLKNGLYINCRFESCNVRVQEHYKKVVIDNFSLANEVELLHTINECISKDKIILLVNDVNFSVHLPDLRSRINSAYHLQIHNPDQEMACLMLREMLLVNKIKVSKDTIDFIQNYIQFDDFINLLQFRIQLLRVCEDHRMTLNLNTFKKLYDHWNRV